MAQKLTAIQRLQRRTKKATPELATVKKGTSIQQLRGAMGIKPKTTALSELKRQMANYDSATTTAAGKKYLKSKGK